MSDFFNEKNTANHKPWKKALCILLSVIIAFGTLVTLTVGSSRLQDWLGIKSMLSTYAAEIVDTDGAVAVDEEAMLADNNTINLENSDGSNTIYLFSEPISFTDENGNLKTKDISVEKQSDNKLKELGYTYTNGQNDYRINFSENSDKGLLVEFDGCSYTIIPQGKFTVDGEKSISENLDREFEIFEYENIYGVGTSLKFYPQLNGVKDEIVLSSNIGKNSFSFELKTENCTASLNDDGTVILVNESGESVQTFSAPFAYDSEYVEGDLKNEHYSNCAYSLEQKEDNTYILTVTVNKDWMESESTVYPIVIDPTTSNISNYKDAGIYSSATSRVIPYGNAATCCFGRTANSEYGYGRVLNYFSWPSAIKKGAAINSAYIWERETTGRTTTTYVAPCLVSEHWVEGSVTWENRPGYYSSTTMARKNINSKSTDKSGDPYWYKFNIASAVKYWADGTYHNYGLLFRSSEEDDKNYNWRAFASKQHSTSAYRPYTVINYTNDATAPTVTSVTGNATSWTKNNVTLTVNGAADNSGGVGLHSTPYSFSTTKGSYNWQSAKTKTFTSNCTVYVYVRDAWDNIRLVSTQTINKIDKTAPELPVVTDNPTEWTNSDVALKVSSSDSDSGIAAYSFSTTEGTYSWQTTNTKTVTENTAYYIYAKDNAGNISTAATVNVNKIDKQAPTTPQVTYDTESWANTDVVLTASSTDLESGVEQYSFSDTADSYDWQNENTKTVSNISTIYVSAKDSAGNISDTFEVNLKIDKVSPNGTVAADNPDNWVKSVTITANAEDNESGLPEAPYSFSSDEGVYNWQEQNTKTITHNGTYYVYVRDLAGNITLLDTVVVDKVDSSTPSINDINLEDIGDKTVITIDAHDAQSGICQYSFDNGKTWQSENVFEIEKDSLNYLAVKVSDNVGNVSATKYYDIYKPQIYYENGKFGFYNPNPKCECDIYYSYTFIGGWTKYEEPIPISENRKFVYVSFYQNIFAINFNDHKISINNDLTTDIFDYKEIKTDYTLSYNSAEFDITRQYKDGKWSFSVFNGLTFIDNGSMIKITTPDFNELFFVRKSRYLYENETNGFELSVVYNEADTDIVEYIFKYGDYNYHYNISGELKKISNAYGDLFTFSRNLRYILITDGAGRVTRLTVLSGRIINVKDASGGSIGYAYSNNNLKTVTDQAGVTLNQYEYTDGKLTKSDDKSIFYDSQGRITEYLLDNGYSTKFEYSDNSVAILTSDGSSSSITYNIWGNISSATDEYGDTTTYTYDDNQRLTKTEKNNKVISSYTYNPNGLLTSKTENGKEYTYSYDSKDRLIQETDPDNTYNYRYDDNDRVAVKIENSIHTYYLYDDNGNVTFSGQIDSEKDYAPDAYDENYQYDSVIRYTYENGRLVKTIDVDNNCTTVNTYDNYGNIIKTATTIENEDGTESIGITEDTYDILDRLISTKSNDKETTYTYDAAGRTLLINANGEYTRTVYDNHGRVIQEIDNDDYDPALDDLPVDYLDYDVGHRYYYDSVGNLVKEINKYDIVTDYTYSSVGTLEKMSFDIYDYYYYKNGNCDRIDVSGKTIVDYDYNITDTEVSLNNGEMLNRISYADGYTEEEKTDKYGNILNKYHNGDNFSYYSFLSLSSSANKLMYKNQDTNEYITTVSADDSYSYSRGEVYGNPSFEYQMSTEDDVTTVNETHFEKEFNTVINENSISYTSAGATVNLAYESDEDSQTATQTMKNGDLTIFSAEYSYNEEDERYVKSYSIGSKTYFNEYDDDGNIISDERNQYTYNDYGELVSVAGDRNSSYTYDDRGNILTKIVDGATTTYSYENTDWKDQLTSVNGVELTYDANGNLKSYGEKQYTWNYGKSLGSITDGENIYSYTYNENGIRASKNINGVKTEINTINGKVLAQKTGEDILYFQYDALGIPLCFVYNDTAYYYITNFSNDVVGIMDSAGNIIAEYEYDEWGKLISVEAESEEAQAIAQMNPLRYRGYYYDNETGYYYLQSRYYDPELGRFISADDLSYIDASGKISINAYAYCENNPKNYIDVNGHLATEAIGGSALYYFIYYVLPEIVLYGTLIISGVAIVYIIVKAVCDSLSGSNSSSSSGSKKPNKSNKQKEKEKILKNIPNSLKKGDKVDLSKFDSKISGKKAYKAKNGWRIEKDTGHHGGREWKLINKAGKRIASLGKDGTILAK